MFDTTIEVGDYKEALACSESGLHLMGPGEAWTDLQVKLSAHIGESREDLLWRLNRAFPGAEGPSIMLARLLLEEGDFANAIPLLTRLASVLPRRSIYGQF